MKESKEILRWIRDRIKEEREYIRKFKRDFNRDFKDRFYDGATIDLQIVIKEISKLELLEELERFIKEAD